MQSIDSRDVMIDDMYIFDANKIVVLCKSFKFQRMKRNILHNLLDTNHEKLFAIKFMQSTSINRFQLQQQFKSTNVVIILFITTFDANVFDVLTIIAIEVNIHVTKFIDDVKINDLDVDFLLIIDIFEKLRDQTNLILSSSLLVINSTIVHLKSYFQSKLIDISSMTIDDENSDVDFSSHSISRTKYDNTIVISTLFTSKTKILNVSTILLFIVAQEIDIDLTKISFDTIFAKIDVDSLLIIFILNAFKNQTKKSLLVTFFQVNFTFVNAQKALNVARDTSLLTIFLSNNFAIKFVLSKQKYKSKFVFFQKRSISSKLALFFLSNDANSLFLYINLFAFSSNIAIYEFDFFFHSNLENYTILFKEIATIYIEKIRSFQSQKSYMLDD